LVKDSEQRVLIGICTNGAPLGVEAIALCKKLDLHQSTVSFAAAALVRKGYCTRERIGMRVFWHPTAAALTFVEKLTGTGAKKESS
jgi:predicted transcriptional regulator